MDADQFLVISDSVRSEVRTLTIDWLRMQGLRPGGINIRILEEGLLLIARRAAVGKITGKGDHTTTGPSVSDRVG
jgi:hypothetical protein